MQQLRRGGACAPPSALPLRPGCGAGAPVPAGRTSRPGTRLCRHREHRHATAPHADRRGTRWRTGPWFRPAAGGTSNLSGPEFTEKAGQAARESERSSTPSAEVAWAAISMARPEAISSASRAAASGRTAPRQTRPSPKTFTSARRPGKSVCRPSAASCRASASAPRRALTHHARTARRAAGLQRASRRLLAGPHVSLTSWFLGSDQPLHVGIVRHIRRAYHLPGHPQGDRPPHEKIGRAHV